jgi:FKBP-type peptidyl-prolyl cis-trans isomerase FklB
MGTGIVPVPFSFAPRFPAHLKILCEGLQSNYRKCAWLAPCSPPSLWRRIHPNVTIDNMRKSLTAAVLLAAGTMLAANVSAQQTPAATTQNPSSTTSKPSAKTSTPAKTSTSTQTLSTRKDKFSYALGMNFGSGWRLRAKDQSIDYDPALVVQGVRDALNGSKTLMTTEESQAVLKEVGMELQKEQQAKMKEAADKNKTDGEAFLTANKEKEGVVALPDGLQYKILTEGNGPKPTASDTVVCNYKGTLIDGTEFDSSYKRGKPATFPVSRVIKGWTEALQLMPVGSKWQLFIPPDLAYGANGAGGEIGPNSTLVFEVDLLSIQANENKDQGDKSKEVKPDDKKSDDKTSDDQKPPDQKPDDQR